MITKQGYSLISTADGMTILTGVAFAETAWSRLIGLIGTSAGDEDYSLLMRHTRTVHTFGMLFSLDVLFIDSQTRCAGLALGVKPGTVVRGPRGTIDTLETNAHVPSVFARIRHGDALQFRRYDYVAGTGNGKKAFY